MHMKKITYKTILVLVSIFSILIYSCTPEDKISTDQNYVNFDFKTTKQIKISVSTLNSENKAIGGVFVQIYTQNPLTAEGLLKENSSDFLAFKGITSTTGRLNCEIAPATYIDSLSILVNHIGLPSLKQIKIVSNAINVVIGGSSNQNTNKINAASKTFSAAALPDPRKLGNYYVLGSWDALGKPDYLVSNDIITNDFVADINTSLPERISLAVSNPEYLNSSDGGDMQLIADSEVWVTFVHEGATYKNALGYYTHQTGNPPASTTLIRDQTIIFPNVSYNGSGGSLISGNKVQLLYLDPSTNKYTTVFPAGTTVAWFFIAGSFNSTINSIGSGYAKYYSDKRFNPETNSAKKKHNVVLKDNIRQLLLIGFEDINRQTGSDEDFNDGTFYATFRRLTAVNTDQIKSITYDKINDADGDGVDDSIDEYPTDRTKAFNNYYPSINNVGTLAYEDLWPMKGDYDFNDLVVDYNFNQVTNAFNEIVEVNAALTVRAIGAALKNAFSLEFSTSPANVKSVTGQSLNNSVFALNSNGTEQNQSLAVVPIFDDPSKVLGISAGMVNTINGRPYITPKKVNVKIEFITPMSFSSFGTVPYNPFIVVNGIRGKEIHLAASAPTDLVDKSIFGTGDDDTNLAIQKYYMSDASLPWAINTPVQFAYPLEREDIRKGFNFFNTWSESRGSNYEDWYINTNGYRDSSKLFKIK
jgi:LruC domain-containing protein